MNLMENIRADGEVSYCKGRSNLANLKWQGARPICRLNALHVIFSQINKCIYQKIFYTVNTVPWCTIFAGSLKSIMCHRIFKFR